MGPSYGVRLSGGIGTSAQGDKDEQGNKNRQRDEDKGSKKSKKDGSSSTPNIVKVDLNKLPKDLAKELKRFLDRQDQPAKSKTKAAPAKATPAASSNTRDLERRLDSLAREIEDLRKALRSPGGDEKPKKKRKSEDDEGDEDEKPKKKKKKKRRGADVEEESSLVRNIVGGVVLVILLVVVGFVFWERIFPPK